MAAAGLALGLMGCTSADDPRPDAAVPPQIAPDGLPDRPYYPPPPVDRPVLDGLPPSPYDADPPVDQGGVQVEVDAITVPPVPGGTAPEVWPQLPDAGADAATPDARAPLTDPAGGVSAPFADASDTVRYR